MPEALQARLEGALRGTPLAARLALCAAPLLERRAGDACVAGLDGAALRGLARVVASNAEAARYLSSRPALFETLVALEPESLGKRAADLALRSPSIDPEEDLEGLLDELRLLRRDETVVAACCQFGGIASFDAVSSYLSSVAETCVRHALLAAERDAEGVVLSVVGMGKIAGRELTYHSDLDVIFLYPDHVEDVMRPSRTAQRLIAYLTTMTRAGVAYAVDSRLRPSGGQGALVSTYSAYQRYQTHRAALWEHLALMRARAIAGLIDEAQEVLDNTRAALLRDAHPPWDEIALMQTRVEKERGDESGGALAFKAGAGGLMNLEFLATGALLATGKQLGGKALPAIPAMLRTVDSPRIESLLEGYAFLRRVEACARWVYGRPVESMELDADPAAVVAELVESGLDTPQLAARIAEVRTQTRTAWNSVVEARSISALEQDV